MTHDDDLRKRRIIAIVWRLIPAVVRAWLRSIGVKPGDTLLLLVGKRRTDAEIRQAVGRGIAAGKSRRAAYNEAAQELEMHPRTVRKRYARLRLLEQ